VEHGIAVADSGSIRVPGAPWQRREPGGSSEVLFRYMDAATAGQHLKGACPLTAGEQQMLLAVHEAGHTFAMHATGLEYGEITINPRSPESRDGRTGLKQLARAERRELPRTAREAATLAPGGWVATETWLEVATASRTKLREDKLNVCHAQIAAADDHYNLMCFPTPQLTAYLHGAVQPPDDWQSEVIVAERLRQELTAMFVSRRPKVIQLAETVTMTRDASVEIITETLGDPGRAR
jgi:hypothetical protein